MPCNGVTVTKASLPIFEQLHRYLKQDKHGDHRRNFIQWMAEQGVEVSTESFSDKVVLVYVRGMDYVIRVYTDRIDVREYELGHKVDDRVIQLLTIYSGMVAQANIVSELDQMGLGPRDFKEHPDGSIEVCIDLSSAPSVPNMVYRETARVRISLEGQVTLVTENGAYDAGKRKLDLLTGILKNNIGLVPSGEYESHRHDHQQEQLSIQW